MAKKATKAPAKKTSKANTVKKPQSKAAKPKTKASSGAKRKQAPRNETAGAREALVGLLETPLVAEVIAAGAAAALATLTQQALSRRADGGTAKSLKLAAKAAATAMGTRLATEFDEIVRASKEAEGGSK